MATKIWLGNDTGNEGDWSTAANWSPSGVPGAGDNVYFEDSAQDADDGLDQSAILLASLNIDQSFTGKIGTTSAYLQVGATKLNIGYNYGPAVSLNGSPRLKIDLGTGVSTVTIYNAAASATETSKPPIRLKCNNVGTIVDVRKGKVGIAYDTGETSSLATVISSYITAKASDAEVYIGSGVTLVTLTQPGGDVTLKCAATTVTSYGGTLETSGTGAITTMNAKGGTVTCNSTGTVTTCNIDGGLVDFTKAAAARTVTTMKLNPGGQLKRDSNLTITNPLAADVPVLLMANAA
jgi:hypothetical protein